MKRFVVLVTTIALLLIIASGVGATEERVGDTKEPSASLMSTMLTVDTLVVDSTPTAGQLAQAIIGSEVTFSSVAYTGHADGSGVFSGGSGVLGIPDGIILASGKVVDVLGPNTSDAISTDFGLPGDSNLNSLIPGYTTYDATVLEFDFVCPPSTIGEDVISFTYVFASEEYNEYVNSIYNDVFGFFLNGTNIALLPDGVTPVSINNVNNGYSGGGGLPGINPSNPAYYINNDLNDWGGSINIEADGLTVVLGAQAAINPGVNHMKLAIADAGDHILDSWVFIQGGSFHCAPLNNPPVIEPLGTYSGVEGSGIFLGGASVLDLDDDPLTYLWAVDSPLCSFDDATLLAPTLTCTDNGSFSVMLTADDGQASASASSTVEVLNAPPVVSIDAVAPALVPVGQVVTGNGSFSDPGASDTHSALWEWGDGVGESVDPAVSPLSAGHGYAAPGIYVIKLTVTDDDGGVGSDIYASVVVYDPSAGFVTGGGWIDSPAGAYVPDPTLTGKATFGFVSKYKKGTTIPDGNTEFQFQTAGLNFHSTSYEWLVVTGGDYARFKGEGTINGEGAYKFLIWAGDDTLDTFRIKIWQEDEFGVETIFYDNGFDQAIEGGSIIVHAK